jgi:hypothetical protein
MPRTWCGSNCKFLIMKTYRERLQALIRQIDKCYDEIGTLRDYSSGEVMKRPLNNSRGLLGDAASQLRNLDNALSKGHASMETSGKGFCEEND